MRSKLNQYIVDEPSFKDHILKKYDLDISDLKDYEVEVQERVRSFQEILDTDIHLYLYLIESCDEKVRKHFMIYFNYYLFKQGYINTFVADLDKILTSQLHILCFIYTVQYFFL